MRLPNGNTEARSRSARDGAGVGETAEVRAEGDHGRAEHRLQLLCDSLDRIASARLDLSEVVESLAREVARPGFAHCCAVHLCDDGGNTLRLAALHHLDPEAGADAERTLREIRFEIGEGLVGGVAQTGETARVDLGPDSLAGSRPEYQAHARRYPISSLIAVPLRASGALLGTLVASRYAPAAPFTHGDQRMLEQLATHAALALENARLYARARRERERAELANRAKDEFLAMLGHELRNPLSPILTAVQLMRLRGGDTLTKERGIIERQVHRMVRLVDDLLDVSRITRGKVQLNRAPIELATAVAEAIESASPLLEERAHKLVTDVPSSGMRVDADFDRLGQIIANLLTNAAKYTPPGGKIEVAAEACGGRVALTVRDDGVGIDPQVLPRVFDLFAQAEQGSDRAQGGLGLGLAIARSLAELHDGTLSARSEGVGRGSEFTLELPLLAGPAHQVHAEVARDRPQRARAAARRILVVDDNRDAADTLAEALADLGHDVRVAHDGPAALALAAQFPPDLALLDIGLPVMDGYELCRKLAEQMRPQPPAMVAVTGYGQSSDRLRSREAGFHAHLVKPVDLDCLEGLTDELLAERAPV